MKQWILIILSVYMVGFWGVTSRAGVSADDALCDHIDLHWLRRHAPVPPSSEIVSRRDVGGICEVVVKTNGDYLSLYAGIDFFIAGTMYQHQIQLTKNRIYELKKAGFINHKEALEDAVVFEYSPVQPGDRIIYMFTDPLCPYCTRAYSEIRPIADKYNARVKLLFYNVHGLDGRKKSIEAVCRNLTFDEYLDESWKIEENTDTFQCEKGVRLYERSIKEARRLGITDVPQFYLDDGTSVRGADMTALDEALEEASKHEDTIVAR